MIIPVRCFSCNRVIASKYRKYKELVAEYEQQTSEGKKNENIISANEDLESQKVLIKYSKIFDQLGLGGNSPGDTGRYCCKRHIISHIDLIDKI